VAREADEAARGSGDLVGRSGALGLGSPQLHTGDEAAQVAVSLARGHEQQVLSAVGAGDFRSDVRADAGLFRGHVESWRPYSPSVGDSHGGHVELAQAAWVLRDRRARRKLKPDLA
jgi:hypothetical protein